MKYHFILLPSHYNDRPVILVCIDGRHLTMQKWKAEKAKLLAAAHSFAAGGKPQINSNRDEDEWAQRLADHLRGQRCESKIISFGRDSTDKTAAQALFSEMISFN